MIQPVRAIAELCAERGVPLHLDAVQASAWLPLRLDDAWRREMPARARRPPLRRARGVGIAATERLPVEGRDGQASDGRG